MAYQLTIEPTPAYLHARVTGERTPENARRFLRESYAACVKSGHSALLLEMNFTGPSLSTTSVFDVVADRAPEGLKLRKIAYVQGAIDNPAMPAFAETVAANRGVNVKLFPDVAKAVAWLSA